MIMNDAFTLSTSSNQTYREREVEAMELCQHTDTATICWHCCPLNPWDQNRVVGLGASPSLWILLSCHRALLEGSSVMASSKYLQISYQSSTGSHSCVSPALVPVMRPGAGELKSSSREWGHLDWAMILVTCSPSWCCRSPSAGVQVRRGPKRKKGE